MPCLLQVAVSEAGSMRAQLSTVTYYGLVKLLGTCAAGSASVAEALLAGPLVDTVKTLLQTSTLFSSATTNTASVLKSNGQLADVRSSDLILPRCVAARQAAPLPSQAGSHCTHQS